MKTLEQWAEDHMVLPGALAELREILTAPANPPPASVATGSESRAQQEIRLAASLRGIRLWRNNVGAVTVEDGRHVRFGLANESVQMNRVVKSSDLIGITPLAVAPRHVGQRLGVFTAIEVKRPGWTYRGNAREVAQLAWLQAVAAFGGFASFATGPEVIDTLDNSG